MVEVAVVVAGVADELEGAGGWEGMEELRQGGGGEVAGGGDGNGGVGGEDGTAEGLGAAELRVGLEAAFERAEELDLEAAEERARAEGEREIQRPGLLEWVADGTDGGAFGYMEQGAGDGGEEVGVFVGVEVGDVDAGALEFLHLGEGLADDVVGVDGAAEEGLEEIEQRGAEGVAVGAEQGGDGFGVGDGGAVCKHDMAPHSQLGVGEGDLDGVLECGAGGHEGGRGEDAGGVEFGDGAVDAEGEAEVVGVEDEAGGHAGVIVVEAGAEAHSSHEAAMNGARICSALGQDDGVVEGDGEGLGLWACALP